MPVGPCFTVGIFTLEFQPDEVFRSAILGAEGFDEIRCTLHPRDPCLMRGAKLCAVYREGDRDCVAQVGRTGAEFFAQDGCADGVKPRARDVLFDRKPHDPMGCEVSRRNRSSSHSG